VFEDNLKTDKLRPYPKGYYRNNGSFKKFEVDFEIINYNDVQLLEEEQKHFLKWIEENKRPLTDGLHGLEVLEILKKAQQRLRNYMYEPSINEQVVSWQW